MTNILARLDRLGRWLGGIERVDDTGLPVEELAHPLPLLAMALLGVNDHLLKGSGWVPGWLTGKLSDFAGLFFFPLFVTATADTALYLAFRLSGGRTPRYSLRMWKLYAAASFTAVIFVPLKLSDRWGTLYIEAMHLLDVLDLFGGFQVTRDPTDLLALVMLPLAVLFGRRFLVRIPLGRLAELRAAARSEHRPAPKELRKTVKAALADVRSLASAHPARLSALDSFVEAYAAALAPAAPGPRADGAQRQLDRYRRALESHP